MTHPKKHNSGCPSDNRSRSREKQFYYDLFDSLLRVLEKRVVNCAGRLWRPLFYWKRGTYIDFLPLNAFIQWKIRRHRLRAMSKTFQTTHTFNSGPPPTGALFFYHSFYVYWGILKHRKIPDFSLELPFKIIT